MKKLPARGQRRLHFADESDGRRQFLLTRIAELGTASTIYSARGSRPTQARDAILAVMIPGLIEVGVRRLVLDSRQGQDGRDRSAIYRATRHEHALDLTYHHQPSAAEPLLWLPDAVGWAWGRGGHWRRHLDSLELISAVRVVKVV